MLDPENAELWVHLHLCLTKESDHAMKSKAIFRAYQLSPEMPFVQEYLLKHYMASRKTYNRAFHLILRITQQQQSEQAQTGSSLPAPALPIVTATLAFLNAKAYFTSQGTLNSQRRYVKKTQLLEAISLINIIEKRDDLI